VLVIWYLVWPEAQNISVLSQEAGDWQTKLQEAQQSKQKLAGLEVTYQKMQDDESRIMNAVPNKGDVPGLLVQLETMASQNGLILNSLDFTYPEAGEVASAPPVTDTDTTTTGNTPVPAATSVVPNNVNTLAVSLDLTGDYVALKNFLQAVENNLRLSDVTKTSFSEQQAGSGLGPASETGKLSIGINVYYKQ
jgi:Tfp pilus assembly protein PilO